MGINYTDEIVLYNRYYSDSLEEEYFFGTELKNVRCELTEGANISNSGLNDASRIVVKIPNDDLPKPYLAPMKWRKLPMDEMTDSFTFDKDNKDFLVVKKKDGLNIDEELPTGKIDQEDFFNYMKRNYGYCYLIHTVDFYKLIPRFEIGGR